MSTNNASSSKTLASSFRDMEGALWETDVPHMSGISSNTLPIKFNEVNLKDGIMYSSSSYATSMYTKATTTEMYAILDYYCQEATLVSSLMDLTDDAKKFFNFMYTYRTFGRSIPQVNQELSESEKQEVYQKIVNLLQPEVKKLLSLMEFRDAYVGNLVNLLQTIYTKCEPENVFPSTTALDTIVVAFSYIVDLDTLKNSKGSFNNDFSMYKRAVNSLPDPSAELVQEKTLHQTLYMFLGQTDQFSVELKNQLKKNGEFMDQVIMDVIEYAANAIEKEHHVLPQKKHMFLKSMALGIYLLDYDANRNVTELRGFPLDRYGEIIRRNPFAHVFADISISLSLLFSKCPNLRSHRWAGSGMSKSDKAKLEGDFELRENFASVAPGFRAFLVNFKHAQDNLKTEGDFLLSHSETVYSIANQALNFLSKISTSILDGFVWKLNNPNTMDSEISSPYEQAMRFNYNSEDKSALLVFITMLKDLSDLLMSLDPTCNDAITLYIGQSTQYFINHELEEFICQFLKKKRTSLPVLQHIQTVSHEDIGRPKNSDFRDIFSKASYSTSQHHFIRAFLEFTYHPRSKDMKGGMFREKNYSVAQTQVADDFFHRARWYPHMLNLRQCVAECSDLSYYWYKEFYLELSKEIQFPIVTSMPSILVEHVLLTESPEFIQNIFYPFEIYNDVGHSSLYNMQVQHLFDEVVAEANLCLDLVLFYLTEKIFLHYKTYAALGNLPTDVKAEALVNTTRFVSDLPYDIFVHFFKLKSLVLLGRSVNISRVLAESMTALFRRNIDIIITRFEGSDFTYLIEMDALLSTLKTAHRSMISHGLNLDSFTDTYNDANDSVGLEYGRVSNHVISELINDIVPNYAYNSISGRFRKSSTAKIVNRPSFPKQAYSKLHGNKNLNDKYDALHMLTKQFIGTPHFAVVMKYCGHFIMEYVMAELLKCATKVLNEDIAAYIVAIRKAIPANLKLPLLQYGTEGCISYFKAQLEPLLKYKQMEAEVFESFQKFGNCLIVIKFFSESQSNLENVKNLHVSGLVTGKQNGASLLGGITKADNVFKHDYCMSFSENYSRMQSTFGESEPYGLLKKFSSRIRSAVKNLELEDWVLSSVDMTKNLSAFYRVWSAIQFVYSVYCGFMSFRGKFGEGVQWAGCAILNALGQQKVFDVYEFNGHILTALQQDPLFPGVYDALRNPNLDIAEVFEAPARPDPKAITVAPKLAEFLKFSRFIYLVNKSANANLQKRHV